MTIIGLLLIGVPFIGLCAVILVMGLADIWRERGNRTPRETAAQALEGNGDPVEKEARNERAAGNKAKLFQWKLVAGWFGRTNGSERRQYSNPYSWFAQELR
jgi:hypothetical protein